MEKVILRHFTRRSVRDYVPKIFKHPKYNPPQKGTHEKVPPHPEVVKMRDEFYREVNKYELIAERNAIFEDIQEKFKFVQGYKLKPDEFEEALTLMDHERDRAAIQLNIEECLVRKAFVSQIETTDYYLKKARQFHLKPKNEVFRLTVEAVMRFAVHYNYHQKSPFDSSAQEKSFTRVLHSLFELYQEFFTEDKEATSKLESLFEHVYICVSDTKYGLKSLTNLGFFLAVIDRFNDLKNKKTFDVRKVILGLSQEERSKAANPALIKAESLSWLFEKYAV